MEGLGRGRRWGAEEGRARAPRKAEEPKLPNVRSRFHGLPPHAPPPFQVPVLSNGLFGVCASTGLPLSCLIMVQDDFCQW